MQHGIPKRVVTLGKKTGWWLGLAMWAQCGATGMADLVQDGEFEDARSLGTIWVARGLQASLDPASPANGAACVQLTPAAAGAGELSQELRGAPPLSGIRVALQLRYRRHGTATVHAWLTGGSEKVALLSADDGRQDVWIPVRRETAVTLPDGPVTFRIEISGPGTVWLDDAHLVPSLGPNLLRRGGFEGGKAPEGLAWELGNHLPDRQGFAAKLVADEGRTDKNSLRITLDRDHDLNIFFPSLTVAVKPDTAYQFSAWMRGGGLEYKLCAQDANAYTSMYFDMCVVGEPVDGWTPVSVAFKTPASCQAVKLILLRRIGYPDSPTPLKASLWVDDLELREVITDATAVTPRHHQVAIRLAEAGARPLKKIRFGLNTGMGYQGISDCQLTGETFLMRYDYPPLAAVIRELGINCLRWGGTSVNWWDWKKDWYFDPQRVNHHARNQSSINQINYLSKMAPKLWGEQRLWFDQFLELCRTTGVQPLVCLNVNTDTCETAVDLLKDMKRRNWPGLDYELGNELHGERYIRETRPFADAVRRESPQSQIGTTEDADDLAAAVEREGWHDAWIPHYYYREVPGDEHALARHVFTDAEYMMAGLHRRSQERHPGRKMWLTEWGWTPAKSLSREKTLLAALWNADVLMHHLDYSAEIQYSIYHSLFDIYFGIINYDAQGRIIRSVPFFAHQMFYQAIQGADRLLAAEVTGMPLLYASQATVALEMVPAARRGDDIPGLVVRVVATPSGARQLLLLNRSKDYQHLQLADDHQAPLPVAGLVQLAGRDYRDLFKINGPTVADLRFATEHPPAERETVRPVRLENPGSAIVLPPYSFTILRLVQP